LGQRDPTGAPQILVQEIKMSNAQQNIAAFAAATNNELFDADYKGGTWMIDAVQTSETIDQIIDSAKNWAEKSTPTHGVIAGFPFVSYSKMRARRGDARRSLSVVDFGNVRYVLECNLSHF
jgi:hypothetical protein